MPDSDSYIAAEPIQLISIDDKGNCRVEEKAAKMISQVKTKIAVIGISGLSQTGKSFLMNKLLGMDKGFDVTSRSTMPSTSSRGLWVWGQPVLISEDLHAILVDTEGLSSPMRSKSVDDQLISLSLLLSSLLIWNHQGVIDKDGVKSFEPVLTKAANSSCDTRMPKLLWVFRDSQIIDVSADELFESALSQNERLNLIREFFPIRNCFSLPPPSEENIDPSTLSLRKLKPEFRTQLESLIRSVYTNLPALTLGLDPSQSVDGGLFIQLARSYCASLSSGRTPSILKAIKSIKDERSKQIMKDAAAEYRNSMNDQVIKRLPVTEQELIDACKKAKAVAMQSAKVALATLDMDANALSHTESELRTKFRKLKQLAKDSNFDASFQQGVELLRELVTANPVAEITDEGTLKSHWDSLISSFEKQAVGPAVHAVFMNEIVPMIFASLGSADLGAAKLQAEDSQKKIEDLQIAHARLKVQNQLLQEKIGDTQNISRDQLSNLERRFSETLSCEKRTYDNLINSLASRFENELKDLTAQNTGLVSKLQLADHKMKARETEISNMAQILDKQETHINELLGKNAELQEELGASKSLYETLMKSQIAERMQQYNQTPKLYQPQSTYIGMPIKEQPKTHFPYQDNNHYQPQPMIQAPLPQIRPAAFNQPYSPTLPPMPVSTNFAYPSPNSKNQQDLIERTRVSLPRIAVISPTNHTYTIINNVHP